MEGKRRTKDKSCVVRQRRARKSGWVGCAACCAGPSASASASAGTGHGDGRVMIVLSGAWKGRWAFVDGSVNVSGVEVRVTSSGDQGHYLLSWKEAERYFRV